MRSAKLAAVGGGVLVAVALVAAPVNAVPTDATFTVTAGTLAITAPAGTVNIGSGAPGTVINGSLGSVTVTDARASDDGSWTATVTSTDFSAGAAASQVTLATEIDYWSGPATSESGTGTLTPGQVTAANKLPLDNTTPLTAFTHADGTGNNTAVWNPTISVRVPLDSQAGTYTGTVTHSVG